MPHMLTSDQAVDFSRWGRNRDGDMNRIWSDIVQNRTDNCFTDCVEMIVADDDDRPFDSVNAQNRSLCRPGGTGIILQDFLPLEGYRAE